MNEEIDRMRHAYPVSPGASRCHHRCDVSCIYGLGSEDAYYGQLLQLELEQCVDRDEVLAKLVDIQYKRNDFDFHRGTFRVRGDVLEVFPVHEESHAIRIEFFGDEVDGISQIDPLRGQVLEKLDKIAIYPASHYVVAETRLRICSARSAWSSGSV